MERRNLIDSSGKARFGIVRETGKPSAQWLGSSA
jgi:hypothetical protein